MKDKKFIKKKQREKEVQKKLLERRNKLRQKKKLEKAAEKEGYHLREKGERFVRPENVDHSLERRKEVARIERTINADIEETKNQIIKAKNKGLNKNIMRSLEDNYRVLLALREEFLQENADREATNKDLEDKGINTLSEKLEKISEEQKNI